MVMRISFAISAVLTLVTFLFLFAAIPEADAQGCDVPPTACLTCVMDPKSPRFCPKVVCTATVPGGTATGVCTTPCKCGAKTFTGQQGKQEGVGDAKGKGEALKGIMDMLKQAMKGGGGGGGGQPPPPPETGKEGCTQYYQVTAPSADPCASYVPPTSSSLLTDTGVSGSDALLDALNAGGGELLNVSDTLLGTLGGLPEETTKTKTDTSPPSTASSPIGENLSGQQVNLQSGTRGDIVVTEGGATIIAQARDT